MHLQAIQNKCIRFCLKFDDRSSLKSKDFEKIIYFFLIGSPQFIREYVCSTYKFFTKNRPNYFDEMYVYFKINGVRTCSSHQKLNVPRRKTTVRQKALSYVGPSLRNNLTKTLKTSTGLNAFKHNNKQHSLNEFKKKT